MRTEGVRVPTSVLLAVLAAAGLLALAPALVRRYDATERLAAEREQSTARVLDRQRRRRTVPGSRPVNGARPRVDAAAETGPGPEPIVVAATPGQPAQVSSPVGQAVWVQVGRSRIGAGRRPAKPMSRQRTRDARGSAPRRREPRRQSKVVYRRRRALLGLVLLNLVELVCMGTLSAVVWPALAVTGAMLVVYLVHLRNVAIADARRRRFEARRAAHVAEIQAAIRAEQARRLAARRESLRRAAAARAAAQRDAQRLSQRYVDFDPARRARVRGRQYDTGHVAGL
jgi:hypothetical protein